MRWNRRVNTAPPAGPFAAAKVPPWASAIRETMASPKPVPACLVVKNGSKIRGRSASDSPGPLSATLSSMASGETVDVIASVPPWGIASRALRTRFNSARRSISRSARKVWCGETSSSQRIFCAANCGASAASMSAARPRSGKRSTVDRGRR